VQVIRSLRDLRFLGRCRWKFGSSEMWRWISSEDRLRSSATSGTTNPEIQCYMPEDRVLRLIALTIISFKCLKCKYWSWPDVIVIIVPEICKNFQYFVKVASQINICDIIGLFYTFHQKIVDKFITCDHTLFRSGSGKWAVLILGGHVIFHFSKCLLWIPCRRSLV
jgi:hypothetical protein